MDLDYIGYKQASKKMLTLEELGISMPEEKTYERVPFGKEMRKQFQFGEGWTNMNHGISLLFQRHLALMQLILTTLQVPLELLQPLSLKLPTSFVSSPRPAQTPSSSTPTLNYWTSLARPSLPSSMFRSTPAYSSPTPQQVLIPS